MCLAEGGKPHCTVTKVVGGKVLFVREGHPNGCPYQCSFGGDNMCLCPVHRHLHLRKQDG